MSDLYTHPAPSPGPAVAVVALACRLPGAPDDTALWRILDEGRSLTGPIPPSRWDAAALHDPRMASPAKSITRRAALLDEVGAFDHALFQISPREAEELDPQQRILLELAAEALGAAGLRRDQLAGSRTDVVVGISSHDYLDILPPELARATPWSGLGNALCIAANRISYTFDLGGLSLAVDTACSSSLVALDLALKRLRAGLSDRALVGGVNLLLSPGPFVALSAAGMLSPDGACKPFSAAADGYGRGEGAVVLVIERLADAQRDGRPLRALLCGSAVNQDGASNGITAPRGEAQAAVIRAALADAGLSAQQVTYVEAHGTGTPLGDPIEAQALSEALGAGRSAPLLFGSVKGNLGHLEAAAGLAGVAKVILSLEKRRLPASLHAATLNPAIPAAAWGLSLVTEAQPWPAAPAIAGVSSFGFGGTNAHVLLQAAPPPLFTPTGAPPGLLLLSAHSAEALDALIGRWARWLDAERPDLACALGAAAHQQGPHRHRLAVEGADHAALIAGLQAAFAQAERPGLLRQGPIPRRAPRVGLDLGRHLPPPAPPSAALAARLEALGLPHPGDPEADPALLGAFGGLEAQVARLAALQAHLPQGLVCAGEGPGLLAALVHHQRLSDEEALRAVALLAAWGGAGQLRLLPGPPITVQVGRAAATGPVDLGASIVDGALPSGLLALDPSAPLLFSLGRLWVAGVEVSWGDRLPPPPAPIRLPDLPLQRWWHWNRPIPAAARPVPAPLPPLEGPVAWIFPGQGVALHGLGPRLAEGPPAWRQALEEADAALIEATGRSLFGLLALPEGPLSTALAQPALVALGWALAEGAQRGLGLRPAAVAGHSLGEITAAAVAGALSLPEALRFAAARGRLMAGVPGAMVALEGPGAGPMGDGLTLAADNGPEQVVLAGSDAAVAALLAAPPAGLRLTRLRGEQPFHSPAMAAIAGPLRAEAARLRVSAPRLPWISSRSAARLERVEAEHWVEQALAPVRWSQTLQALADLGCQTFLELGPRATLSALGRRSHPQFRWRHALSPSHNELAQPRQDSPAPPPPRAPEVVMPDANVILSDLTTELASRLGLRPAELDPDASFIELGVDSIAMAEAAASLSARFGVELSVRRFFEDLRSLRDLADYLATKSPPSAAPTGPAPAPTAPPAAPVEAPAQAPAEASAVERLARHQLTVMATLMAQQLAALGAAAPAVPAPAPAPAPPPPAREAPLHITGPVFTPAASPGPAPLSPLMRFRPPSERAARERAAAPQEAWMAGFIEGYAQKTRQSKALAERARPRFADIRAAAGFRMRTKELLYPIAAARAEGSRLWDIDGNCYIDVSMDFGVNLFGHQPAFLRAALHAQLDQGMPLAPRSPLAVEAAERLCRLSGQERAMFCTSGSEAVMMALRLARMKTGRSRVAIFRGSYHGHTDHVLAMRIDHPEGPREVPAAPGVLAGATQEVVLLDYGDPSALERIAALGDTLAAVLVEPVQSRSPGHQPWDFLRSLRTLTTNLGLPLIFDEVITGLRCHPAGVAGLIGVLPDIAVYGKVLGGGLPIGALAGAARLLDGLDGGPWGYGDASYPPGEVTFFASTFAAHPLSMAAAVAVLREVERQGPALHEALGRRTARLAGTLNERFEAEGLPLRVAHFGSLFRFELTRNLDLLFFALLDQGLFVWEGRNLFLSTAHSEADVDAIIAATHRAIAALRQGGLLPPAPEAAPPPAPLEAPMTAAQQQLCRLGQLSPQTAAAYHEVAALDIAGEIDEEPLRAALAALVARHEALRSTFDLDRGQMIIAPTAAVDLRCDVDQPVDPWLLALVTAPLPPQTGPLWRVGWLRRGPGAHTLALVLHHAIADGWSVGLLLRDLCLALDGRLDALPPAPPLRAHSAWLATQLANPAVQAQATWWRAHLQGAPRALSLPTDGIGQPGLLHPGAVAFCRLPEGLSQGLVELGRRNGSTLYMVLLAAWSAFLARVSGQTDRVIGTPVLGRAPEGQEALVGYCTHLLPLRLPVDLNGSLRALLGAVRQRCLDAWSHPDLPFAALIDALHDLFPDRLGEPFPTVIFNLDRPAALPAWEGRTLALRPAPCPFVHHPLALQALQLGGVIELSLQHAADLLSPPLGQDLLAAFEGFLAAAVRRPEAPLGALPWPASRATPVGPLAPLGAASLPAALDPVLCADPDRPVLREARGGAVLTAGALHDESDHLARLLLAEGLRPEEPVGVVATRGIDLIVALLAIVKAGGAYLPLEPGLPPARANRLLAAVGARRVLSPDPLPGWPTRPLRPPPGAPPADAPPLPALHPDQLAAVMVTSGSTGGPKAVGVTHRNLLRTAASGLVEADAVMLMASAVSFDASHLELWCALLAGGAVVLAPPGPQSLHTLGAILREDQVNTAFLTTSLLHRAVAEQPDCLRGLRRLYVGGEALSPRAAGAARAVVPTLVNGYGPTETTTFASTWIVEEADATAPRVPIGRPMAETTLWVLDPALQPVAAGLPGELFVGGAGLTRGYLGRPGLTAQRFVPDPSGALPGARLYATGDRVRQRQDGALEFLGRLDEQVKVRGFRIEPGEVEEALRAAPGVAEACVLTEPDPAGALQLLAFVTARPGVEIDAAALRAALLTQLPAWMVPGHLQTVEAMPRTPAGKVDRRALAALREQVGSQGGALQGPIEPLLAELWRALLQREAVFAHDDLIVLGGSSLTLVDLAARIEAQWGLRISLAALFEARTLRAQASLIAASQNTPEDPGPQPQRVDRAALRRRGAPQGASHGS